MHIKGERVGLGNVPWSDAAGEEMKRELIVVANAETARLFTRESDRDPLEPLDHLQQVHSHEAESTTEHYGRRQKDFGRSAVTLAPHTELKHKEAAAFARLVSKRIDAALEAGKCRHLTVMASSPFLGVIRKALGPAAQAALRLSLDIDLTSYPLDQLERRIDRSMHEHRPGLAT
jgi:protein required for attachment to host cells